MKRETKRGRIKRTRNILREIVRLGIEQRIAEKT